MVQVREGVDLRCGDCRYFKSAAIKPGGWCMIEKSVVFGNKVYIGADRKICRKFKSCI